MGIFFVYCLDFYDELPIVFYLAQFPAFAILSISLEVFDYDNVYNSCFLCLFYYVEWAGVVAIFTRGVSFVRGGITGDILLGALVLRGQIAFYNHIIIGINYVKGMGKGL